MKKLRKILSALLLAALLCALLAGCGSSGGGPSAEHQLPGYDAANTAARLLKNKGAENAELGVPERQLDPAQIYAGLQYTPEMFYGKRSVIGEDAEAKYAESASFRTYDAERHYRAFDVEKEDRELSTLPIALSVGPASLGNYLSGNEDYYWMKASFLERRIGDSRANKADLFFAYSVEGDTLRMRMLKSVELDPDSKALVSYTLGDLVLEYHFAFSGRKLTLSDDTGSVCLEYGRLFTDEKELSVQLFGRVGPGEERIDDITRIDIGFNTKENTQHVSFSFDENSEYHNMVTQNCCAEIREDGLLTFTIPYKDGAKTYQFVYIPLDSDGVILTDGKNVYCYHDWFYTYTARLSDVLAEGVDPSALTEDQAEELIETQSDVIGDLNESFRENDVAADLNKTTGRVTLDAEFLFETDSAELSPEGRAYLESFVGAYAPVILQDKYKGKVIQILIEGHTDPSGTEDYNRDLSERRAKTVADICNALEPQLESYIVIKGCASDAPVLAADGSVDMAASRRVVFKFVLEP